MELLKERIAYPDCNAGCIFDGISPCPKYIDKELTALKVILNTFKD